MHRLRSAELSRHLILLEAVRRQAAVATSAGRPAHFELAAFERALATLERVERTSPALVRRLFTLPQVGAWAGRCLAALSSGRPIDLRYLADLISRAVNSDGIARMTDAIHVSIAQSGLTLNVVLDYTDPYLDLYGPRASTPSSEELADWRERLTGAWSLITRHDRTLAEAIATGLTTLVPLRHGPGRRPRSATSGWAFGAIALSLPPDEIWCADTLIHEFRHVLLGAVCDHFPLCQPDAETLAYAPWRDDPRPLSGLLFGCHAYVGLLDFWRRQNDRMASVRFARWFRPTAKVVNAHIGSETLTPAGTLIVAAMREKMDHFGIDFRAGVAGRLAEDAALDHRIRWRLRNLRPSPNALDTLADAWSAGARPFMVPTALVSRPMHKMAPEARSRLLNQQTGGYECMSDPPLDTAATALIDGRYCSAAAEYRTRITTRQDPDAWAGLALCNARLGRPNALVSKPEIVANLHARLTARTGVPADPDHLGAWLAEPCGDQAIIGSISSDTLPL